MCVETRSKSLLGRGFIALSLLVVFFAIALILPRILGYTGAKLVFSPGTIVVKYRWLDNNKLEFNITNKYREDLYLDKIVIDNMTWYLNNTVIESNTTKNIVLDNVYVEETSMAKIYYRVNNRLYRRLVVIKPPT